jgi:hypothetical protein
METLLECVLREVREYFWAQELEESKEVRLVLASVQHKARQLSMDEVDLLLNHFNDRPLEDPSEDMESVGYWLEPGATVADVKRMLLAKILQLMVEQEPDINEEVARREEEYIPE